MSASLIQLRPHPDSPDPRVEAIWLRVSRDDGALSLRFALRGDLAHLILPSGTGGARRDGLWQHTCFEAFLRPAGTDAYVEYNFAPNGDWAAYQFDGYRGDRIDLDCPPPSIETKINPDSIDVTVKIPDLPETLKTSDLLLGPSAVIESQDGLRSYWALHHPLSKPDFHHIENFKIRVE